MNGSEEIVQRDIYRIKQVINADISNSLQFYGPIEDRTLEHLTSVMAGTVSVIRYSPENKKTDLTEAFGRSVFEFDRRRELYHYTKIKLRMKGGGYRWLGSIYSFMGDNKAFEKIVNGILISGERWKVCFYELGSVDFKWINLRKAEQQRLNASKGVVYERHVGKAYEEKGYRVFYHGIEKGNKDSSIDLIAIKDNSKAVFVQCKNWMNTDRSYITHKDLKAFFGETYLYLLKNRHYFDYTLAFHFVVSDLKILDESARVFLRNNPEIKCIEFPLGEECEKRGQATF